MIFPETQSKLSIEYLLLQYETETILLQLFSLPLLIPGLILFKEALESFNSYILNYF